MIAGFALLVWGSGLLVDNAVIIAQALGWSEAVIGLTIVAAGTSMPELATSVVAALKKRRIVDCYLFFNHVITRINAERARDTFRTSGQG